MDGNIFFDIRRLKRLGNNSIIGKTVRIRYPELVEIGDNVILDDFIYISTALTIPGNVHVASGCHLIGGRQCHVLLDKYSTLAPNCVLAAGSDDYTGGVGSPMVPQAVRGNPDSGDITVGRFVIVGAGSVLMPHVVLGEGSAVGALSLVKKSVPPWELHAGVPARKIRDRDKERICDNISLHLTDIEANR
jgi:galactoside O-acetyltransferase